nr:ribosome-inactivating protein [Tanacetum cinerariifolium]
MRLLATLLVLLAAIYLHLGGVQADTKDDKNKFDYNSGTLRPTLHYLNLDDADQREALLQALPSTDYTHRLGFAGNYGSLLDRERTELGHGAINDAIKNLYYGQSQPRALLVIIQMVAEAVRIRHIEHLILRNMYGQNLNCILDSMAISLENRWLDLSKKIQWSDESGAFLKEIQVQSVARRMQVPIAVRTDEQCPYAVPEATKWILYNASTIMNPELGLVIAVETSTQGDHAGDAEDNNSSRQVWNAGNYTQPTISYISGFRKMCLQANGANACIWLANCVIGIEPRYGYDKNHKENTKTGQNQTRDCEEYSKAGSESSKVAQVKPETYTKINEKKAQQQGNTDCHADNPCEFTIDPMSQTCDEKKNPEGEAS